MKFAEILFIIIQIIIAFFASPLLGQTKIKCNLLEVTNRAFEKNPTIKSAANVIKDAEGSYLVQKSIFDYNLFSELSYKKSRYNLYDADPRNQFINEVLKSNSLDFSTGLQRKFRTGQLAELGVNYSFNNSNYPINDYGEVINPFLGNHIGSLSFTLTQPLLRGRGKNIVTASEKISELYIENAKDNFGFSNSYEILKIGSAYWSYYTAYKSLEIYQQNENRVRNVLEMTTELVKADKKPAGDLAQINADLANQERLTSVAQQSLYEAKLNLGLVIGLSEEESVNLDIPIDVFPEVLSSGFTSSLNSEDFIKLALENRNDLKGNQQLYSALEKQVEISENNTKPQLDLAGFVFYGSSKPGNGLSTAFSSFTNNQGQNLGGGARLTFSFPLNNNLAKGNLAKSEIALSDQQIVNENLKRNIGININNAVYNLKNSVLVLEKAKQSLDNYREAFNNEQMRFQTGLTTLLNLIIFQERLTSSELEYLNANLQFANAIIALRHETGTLISRDEKGFSVNTEYFYTIPD